MLSATVNFVSEKGTQALLTTNDNVSIRINGRNISQRLSGCVVELEGEVSNVHDVIQFNKRTGNSFTRKQGDFTGKMTKVIQIPIDYATLAA